MICKQIDCVSLSFAPNYMSSKSFSNRIDCSNIPDLLIFEVKEFFYKKREPVLEIVGSQVAIPLTVSQSILHLQFLHHPDTACISRDPL